MARKRHKASRLEGQSWVCGRCGAKKAWNTYKPWAYPPPWYLDGKQQPWCKEVSDGKPA